jgi:hypothetical protein
MRRRVGCAPVPEGPSGALTPLRASRRRFAPDRTHTRPRVAHAPRAAQAYGYDAPLARQLQSCTATGITNLPTTSQNQNLGPYTTSYISSPFAQGGTCYYTYFSTKNYVAYFQVSGGRPFGSTTAQCRTAPLFVDSTGPAPE